MENLDKICRNHAYVQLSDSPYDSKLSRIKDVIANKHEGLTLDYNEKYQTFAALREDLEGMSRDSVWDAIRNKVTGKSNIDGVKELGDSLAEKRDYLKPLKASVEQLYNEEAKIVYECSHMLEQVNRIRGNYKTQIESLGTKIISLHNLNDDEQGLQDYISEQIRLKESDENIVLSDKDKESLMIYLKEKGKQEMARLSAQYLELKNDAVIADSIITEYHPVFEGYNERVDSFRLLREDIVEQVSRVNQIIHTYETITRNEINLMAKTSLPEDFVHSINRLAEGVENVDKEFSQRLLEVFVDNGNSCKIKDINLDHIVPGLIKNIGGDENEL